VGNYLSIHLKLKIKITLKCRPDGYLRYDILVSLKCKSKKYFGGYLRIYNFTCPYCPCLYGRYHHMSQGPGSIANSLGSHTSHKADS
jgi:hypothetical protein